MIASPYPTARDFFRNCYKPLRLLGKSHNAIRLHEITLNNFSLHLGREATLEDLNDRTISTFMQWMLTRKRKPITVNDNRNRLMALCRFAYQQQLIKGVPNVVALKEPERVPRAWLAEDLDKLFDACLMQRGVICGAAASIWWLALCLVCLFTGERISAVLSLRWDQLDLARRWMTLAAEQRKGGRRDKEWELPEPVVRVLVLLKKTARTPVVFQRSFAEGAVYNRFDAILVQAGLPNDRDCKFHRIRKSTASHYAAAGGDATALLDHSSSKVTKKYLDKRIVKDRSPGELLPIPGSVTRFLAGPLFNPDRLS